MKFSNHVRVPANETGGYSGMPSWRKKWLEEQVRKVELECGCIEDLSIPVLTIIATFQGASIDCVNCHRFSRVVKTVKAVRRKIPDEPMF